MHVKVEHLEGANAQTHKNLQTPSVTIRRVKNKRKIRPSSKIELLSGILACVLLLKAILSLLLNALSYSTCSDLGDGFAPKYKSEDLFFFSK